MSPRLHFAALLVVAAPCLAHAMAPPALERCIEVSIVPVGAPHEDSKELMQDLLEMAAAGMEDALLARHFDAVPVAPDRVTVEPAPSAPAPGAAACEWQALWSVSVTGQPPAFVTTFSATVRHRVKGPQSGWSWATEAHYAHVTRGLDEYLNAVPASFGQEAVAQLQASRRIPGLHGVGTFTEDDVRATCTSVERAMREEFLVRTMTFATRHDAKQASLRLEQGETFESVGRALLRDPAQASFAPVWGSPLEWDRAFTSAVLAAAPHGRGRAPVHRAEGWVVLEVDDSRARAVAPCGGVESEVRQSLSK